MWRTTLASISVTPKTRSLSTAQPPLAARIPMHRSEIEQQWLVATFLLGAVLFNYPILSLFNVSVSVLGIPMLYLFIFAAWAFIICLVAWIAERTG